MSWSATQYLRFEAERERPIRDLLAALPDRPIAAATDLGCGPGTSSALLAEKYPTASIHGIDSAPDMIEAAARRCPGLHFTLRDIAAWSPETPQDIIFANAALHWLPDHADLLPRLASHLAPGGTLAIQMPDNLNEPSHFLMRAIAAAGPWSEKLANAAAARTDILTPTGYTEILYPYCQRIDIWRTSYYPPVAGHAAIAAFYASTGLRPFLDPLTPTEREAFLVSYVSALAEHYPLLPDGKVLLASPRLFIVATAHP